MSNHGKRKLPEWLQRSVQKSKMGFNRVHEELKRMYDESLKVAVDSDAKEKLPTVDTKQSRVVNRFVSFISSVKSSFKPRNRSRTLSSQCETTYSMVHSTTKSGNIADTKRPKMKIPTERKLKRTMPHSEFLKSNVYTNDRVVHEQVEGENKRLSNKSFEMYTEIDEYLIDEDNSDIAIDEDNSDIANSECQSLIEFGSRSSTSRYNADYDKRSVHGYSPLTVDTRCQESTEYMLMRKGGTSLTSRETRVCRFDSIGDHRRYDDKRLSTDSSQYAKISKSLPSQLHSCLEDLNEVNNKPRRSEVIARDRHNDASTSSQNRHKTNKTETKSPMKTAQAEKRMEDIYESHEPNHSGVVRSFYDHTVEEVAECFRKCALIRLAQVCLDEQLDGEYFRDITGDDLKQEPFNMNWFYIKKIFKVMNGWKPKNSMRRDL